jgi:hypothetical protein
MAFYSGSPTWARTRDLRINSPALYQLSYRGTEDYIIGGYSSEGKHFRTAIAYADVVNAREKALAINNV